MIKNILAWHKENSFYSIVLVIILVAISYVCLILSHYFYYTITWIGMEENVANIYYVELANGSPIETINEDLLPEIQHNIPRLKSVCVAYEQGEYNDHLYATPLIGTNTIMTWGKLPSDEQIMQFYDPDLFRSVTLNEKTFPVSGYGTIRRCLSDYTLSYKTYQQLIDRVDYIQLVFEDDLNSKEYEQLSLIMKKSFGNACTLQRYTGINKNALRSSKNMLISSLVLIVLSLSSSMMFVSILINLQKKEIFIFSLCGASNKIIIVSYWFIYVMLSCFSLLIGIIAYIVTNNLSLYNYSDKDLKYPIVFGCFFYILSTAISAFIAARKAIRNIANNYKEAAC